MTNIQHRMIYYAPTRDAVDARHGRITASRTGALFLEWAGIGLLAGSRFGPDGIKRQGAIGAPASGLPSNRTPVDAVVLTQLDRETGLDASTLRFRATPVITVPGAVDALEHDGFENVHQLSTWERIVLRKGDASVTITSVPAHHWPFDEEDPQVMGAILELRVRPDAAPYRVYLSSGTLSVDALEEIPERFPPVDLAVLQLGGTNAETRSATMDARHGRQIVDIVKPEHMLLVPYDDSDVCSLSIRELQDMLRRVAMGHRLTCRPPGEAYRSRVRTSGSPARTTSRADRQGTPARPPLPTTRHLS